MICPYRHVAWYTDLTDAERDEMAAHDPEGHASLAGSQWNAGLQHRDESGDGRAAPASLSTSTSTWCPAGSGDSNFLPIIAKTKAVPELLDDTWQRVSEAWAKEN